MSLPQYHSILYEFGLSKIEESTAISGITMDNEALTRANNKTLRTKNIVYPYMN